MRAGEGLAWTSPAAFLIGFRLGQNSKHVIVACGGVVGEDQCPRVGGRESARRDVEPAALPQAGATPGPRGAAVGPVKHDETALEREARRADWGGTTVED